MEEHWELIEALKQGDPDKAEAVMREHIHRSYREFVHIGQFDQSELAKNEWL